MRDRRRHLVARLRPSRGAASWLASLVLAASAAAAEAPPQSSTAAASEAASPPSFVETVTVTATSTPRAIEDTAATVGVVSRRQIEETLAVDSRGLVLFEPGVLVEGSPARLGLSGFSIRGIGGNRVATRVDGVPLPEQFVFGPLAAPRASLGPESLASVEILRSAGSALYGSDALGGVVSLVTRDPSDYLGDRSTFYGGRLGWDSRADESTVAGTAAGARGRWSAALTLEGRDGGPARNQGTVRSQDDTRTAPNPLDRQARAALGKVVFDARDDWRLRLTAELHRTDTEGEVFTSRTVQDLGRQMGPGVTYTLATEDFDVDDAVSRDRVSLESIAQPEVALADTFIARLYAQQSRTDQRVLELVRTTRGGGPFGPLRSTPARRDGLFRFDQDTLGGELQAKRQLGFAGAGHLLTYGVAFSRDRFDQLRDREDTDPASGAVLPSSAAYPTKYFPRSRVDELGIYVQDEVELLAGRLRVVPGLRYDRAALDADEDDAIFLAGNPGSQPAADAEHAAISPRLGAVVALSTSWNLFAQYARGFRTPPYSEVNVGFTNFTSGYTTLPNPDLDPETSDNLELGLRGGFGRGSMSLTVFDNRFTDFIQQVSLGRNPATGLVEYQARNVGRARIGGLELAGDARLGDAWTLRGAAAWIEGEDRDRHQPLNSVPPPRLVAGASYRPARSWHASLVATYLLAKDASDVDTTTVAQLATPAALVVDATAGIDVGAHLAIEAGVFNLLDETYWEWGDVQGVSRTSPVLDRYTSPGRSAAAHLRFRF
jgi:hemoglobin/transferrin/lactoferrin receptor protein